MRILIPLVGSCGDVQPGMALGLELQSRGDTVVVGAPANYVDFVGRAGLKARRHQVITLSATQPHEPGCGSIAPQGARGILAGSNSVETA